MLELSSFALKNIDHSGKKRKPKNALSDFDTRTRSLLTKIVNSQQQQQNSQ